MAELMPIKYRGYLVVELHLQFHLPDLDGPRRFAVALRVLIGLLSE
jgi:hypothetical protein